MSFSKLGTRKHGGTDCVRPPLKSAMAFSGIAGVVSPEQGERDELSGGPMPSINTKSSEAADMQDLYRRTLPHRGIPTLQTSLPTNSSRTYLLAGPHGTTAPMTRAQAGWTTACESQSHLASGPILIPLDCRLDLSGTPRVPQALDSIFRPTGNTRG